MAPFDGDVTEHEALVQPKPDVFSVEGLRDWLRTQDPAREYDWCEFPSGPNGGCLLSQYLRARGYNPFRDYDRLSLVCAGDGDSDLDRKIALPKPWNVGAALSRCDAYLARTGA